MNVRLHTGTVCPLPHAPGRFVLAGYVQRHNAYGFTAHSDDFMPRPIVLGAQLELLEGSDWLLGDVDYDDELGLVLSLSNGTIRIPLARLAAELRTVRQEVRT